jgi:hypothetical protein
MALKQELLTVCLKEKRKAGKAVIEGAGLEPALCCVAKASQRGLPGEESNQDSKSLKTVFLVSPTLVLSKLMISYPC